MSYMIRIPPGVLYMNIIKVVLSKSGYQDIRLSYQESFPINHNFTPCAETSKHKGSLSLLPFLTKTLRSISY